MPIGKLKSEPLGETVYGSTLIHVTGELFDLEALARICQDLQRWSFFVASVPLNMPGGVSSPPNIMAIF